MCVCGDEEIRGANLLVVHYNRHYLGLIFRHEASYCHFGFVQLTNSETCSRCDKILANLRTCRVSKSVCRAVDRIWVQRCNSEEAN